jgi:hypothetical protein
MAEVARYDALGVPVAKGLSRHAGLLVHILDATPRQ